MQILYCHKLAASAVVCLLCAGGAASVAAEPTYSLTSGRRTGDVDGVRVKVDVGGHLKLADQDEEKLRPLKMSVVGEMRYDERFLQGQPTRTDRLRSIRYYEQAKAAIKIENGSSQPELRLSRAVVSVEASGGVTTMFSPDGPLSQDEADLIDVHANSLLLETLLPGKPVAKGQRWPHSFVVIAGLLGLDSVRDANVFSEIEEVEGDLVKIALQGTVQGVADGAVTTIGLKGRYQFDLNRSRITWLALLLKEDREIGHVTPGVEATARVQVFVTPGGGTDKLQDDLVSKASQSASPMLTELTYQPQHGNYQFSYDRRWHIMTDEPNLMTMRMVVDDELIAQCKVSTPASPSTAKVRLSDFQKDIETSLGDDFGQFTQASVSANDRGQSIRRVIAIGQVDELPVQWNYYHVTDDDGNQVVFAFTFEASLGEQFGAADQAIVASLRFFPPTQQASSRRDQPAK